MSHSAGKTTDSFDLLGLAKSFLHSGALSHFDAQLFIGLLECPRALDHKPFEFLSRLLTMLEQGPDLILPPACSNRRLNRAGQRYRLNWPLKERDIAE